jgi:hypothetical protein
MDRAYGVGFGFSTIPQYAKPVKFSPIVFSTVLLTFHLPNS